MRLLLKIYDGFKTIYQKILRLILFCYKLILAYPLRFLFGGGGCRYSPTCSEYAVDVIEKYGIIKGTPLAIKRVLKCNSWSD